MTLLIPYKDQPKAFAEGRKFSLKISPPDKGIQGKLLMVRPTPGGHTN
jgi:hypothetical protein